MKKADLIDSIAGKSNLPKDKVQSIVEQVFDLIAEGLVKGEKVELRGFGTFNVRRSKERTGRNPRTKEPIVIAARNVPGFKAGKELRDKVNSAAPTDAPPAPQA